jgi:hypothetical protein
VTGGLEELNNPVTAMGFQVVLGGIDVPDAVAAITADQFLSVMPDKSLATVLDETGRWAADRDAANPGAGWIYWMLRTEVALSRLRRIGLLRTAEPGELADQRMADWISRTADYALALGMRSILRPNLESAFARLMQAEMMARALPDLDRPRYWHMAAALIGQMQVAEAAGAGAFAAEAEERLRVIVALPRWRHEAPRALQELSAEYSRLWALRERAAAADSGRESAGQVEPGGPHAP